MIWKYQKIIIIGIKWTKITKSQAVCVLCVLFSCFSFLLCLFIPYEWTWPVVTAFVHVSSLHKLQFTPDIMHFRTNFLWRVVNFRVSIVHRVCAASFTTVNNSALFCDCQIQFRCCCYLISKKWGLLQIDICFKIVCITYGCFVCWVFFACYC